MGRLRNNNPQGLGIEHSVLNESCHADVLGRLQTLRVGRVDDMTPNEQNGHHKLEGYRVVELDEVVALKEVLEVLNPRTGAWHPVHVFYDSGSEITGGTSDLLRYDSYSIPTVTDIVRTLGYNARQDKRFDQVMITLRGGKLVLEVAVNCDSRTQKVKANPELEMAEWYSRMVVRSPSQQEVDEIPMILLGIPHSHYHPKELSSDDVPESVVARYPALSWRRSKFSGKVMF